MKEKYTQGHEMQRVPNKMNPKRSTSRHILIKMPKVKDRILKAEREKERGTYKGVPIRLSADFSKDTLQARKEWQEIFKAKIKNKDLQYNKNMTSDLYLNYHLDLILKLLPMESLLYIISLSN